MQCSSVGCEDLCALGCVVGDIARPASTACCKRFCRIKEQCPRTRLVVHVVFLTIGTWRWRYVAGARGHRRVSHEGERGCCAAHATHEASGWWSATDAGCNGVSMARDSRNISSSTLTVDTLECDVVCRVRDHVGQSAREWQCATALVCNKLAQCGCNDPKVRVACVTCLSRVHTALVRKHCAHALW